MRKYWLTRDGNPGLLLFMLGWAADHHAVEHLAPEEAEAIALAFLQRLFSRIEPPGDAEAQSAPDIPRAA